MREQSASGHIVVGVDGSRSALRAARWAVDEAVFRDVPIRLVCAIKPPDGNDSPEHAARRLGVAEVATRQAIVAIEAADKPVKIEVEIDQNHPLNALARASRSAAMVCVGAVGLRHFQPGRVGSTAAGIAATAHCPVAVISECDSNRTRDEARWIVVEAGTSPDRGILLEAAMDEARLRNAPLRIITCWQSDNADVDDADDVAAANRRVLARLDRRLARWTRRYPELDVQAIAVHGSIIEYLTKHAATVQLVVVGAQDHRDVSQLIGPGGNAALRHADCSLLIVDRQNL
jgi:nucleotide-binding universal stress UspA family protein